MATNFTIFQEAFLSSLALPLRDNVTLFAMHCFGNVALKKYFIVGVLGSFAGCIFSYGFGRVFYQLISRLPHALKAEHYLMAQAYMTRYGIWLALFYWAGPLSLVPLILGFLSVPVWRVALVVALGVVLEYRVILVMPL